MNNSIMMGRLVRDPEINYVENKDGDEIAVANFRLAVDRKFSDDTDFFPCAAFGWLAEFAEKYLFQGIKVVVRGSMENNNYTNKDGVRLRLDDIEFAESKKSRGNEEDDDGGNRRSNSGSRRRSSGSRGNSRSSRSSSGRSGRNFGSSSGRGNDRNYSGSSRNSRSSNRQVDEEFEGQEENYFD